VAQVNQASLDYQELQMVKWSNIYIYWTIGPLEALHH